MGTWGIFEFVAMNQVLYFFNQKIPQVLTALLIGPASHFRYFFGTFGIFFINRKYLFLKTYSLSPISAPVLFTKPHPQSYQLDKKCKKSFFINLTCLFCLNPLMPNRYKQSWALSVFFIFPIIKNDSISFFIQLITYFCTSPI